MTDLRWLVLAAVAGLLGFANLEATRQRRTPGPGSLLLSFTAGYLAYRHGSWLWDSEHTRVVVVALVFCPASLVFGSLWWGTDGAFGRVLIRLTAFLALGVVGYVLASTLRELEPSHALRCGFMCGALAFLPWRSFWRWQRRYRTKRRSRREEQQRCKKERQEAERLRERDQQQEKLLQALVDELRK